MSVDEIFYKGSSIAEPDAPEVNRVGIAMVPETRDIFSDANVTATYLRVGGEG